MEKDKNIKEEIVMRKAKESDLINCEKLIHLPEFIFADGEYPDIEYLSFFLDKNRGLFFVMEKDSQIVAFILGEKLLGKSSIVWYTSVDERFRGQGLGSQMLNYFEGECKKQGIEWIVLHSPEKSPKSLDFYRKMNYNEGSSYLEFNKNL